MELASWYETMQRETEALKLAYQPVNGELNPSNPQRPLNAKHPTSTSAAYNGAPVDPEVQFACHCSHNAGLAGLNCNLTPTRCCIGFHSDEPNVSSMRSLLCQGSCILSPFLLTVLKYCQLTCLLGCLAYTHAQSTETCSFM